MIWKKQQKGLLDQLIKQHFEQLVTEPRKDEPLQHLAILRKKINYKIPNFRNSENRKKKIILINYIIY